jgi:hypothetical protein
LTDSHDRLLVKKTNLFFKEEDDIVLDLKPHILPSFVQDGVMNFVQEMKRRNYSRFPETNHITCLLSLTYLPI